MALLAAYAVHKADGQSLQDYLNTQVFGDQKVSVVEPQAEDVEGFTNFMVHYKAGLAVERAAVEHV